VGEFVREGLATALAQKDPARALRSFARHWREVLTGSDFTAGCSIVAATLEGDRLPAARDQAASAFARWQDLLADALERQGVPPQRSRSLAALVISAIEGAVVLARAERSAAPLERVADELEALVASALPASPA
jgi:TetR/AcrR family transcriptional regulator, lmrAB and yxaGH operons repressor